MKILGAALLVIGVILLIYGLSASDAFASEVSEAFTGEPTDRAMWLMIGGGVAAVVGLLLVLGGRRAVRA